MKPPLQRIEEAVRNYMNLESNPRITNLREGIIWMDRVLNYDCGITDLDGINDTLLYAIEELYGQPEKQRQSLTTISTEIETYLEKIVFLVKGVDHTSNTSMTLINMIEELELSSAVASRGMNAGVFFTEARISSLIGEPDFIEHIGRTYKKRNDIIHNSPVYDIADIYVIARSLLITMIYATIKHLDKIKDVINSNLQNLKESNDLTLIDDKAEVLYNFITHGKANREIKEQVIETFILHRALRQPGIGIPTLVLACNEAFSTKFSESSFMKQLKKLEKDEKIILDDNCVKLTDREETQVNEEIEYFRFQEQLFKQNISEILKKYYAEGEIDKVYLAFNNLIEANYRTDLGEIFNKLTEANNVAGSIQTFKKTVEDVLKSRGQHSEENALDVLIELLSICYSNDFLYRKCSAVIYGDINNQRGIQNYLRQLEREVFLDTNVLLFVMCRYYYDATHSTIPEFNVVRDLLLQSGRNPSINLRTYSEYVLELAYQVRSALLLIPFEEVGFFKDGYSSSNVFFRYYAFLKENDFLDVDVESFEDFMEGFDVYYEDLFEYRPLDRIAEVCESILGDEGIGVVFFDNYEVSKLRSKFEVISNETRGPKTISNDVQMISYLSDRRRHELEPYFVTYDSLFIKMRKFALEEVKRSQFWHLYFPSRFVAHINMLSFKIDAKSFTDDFLSILSKANFIDDTATLADVMSDFMDIRSDSKRILIKRLRDFNIRYSGAMSMIETDQDERSDFNPIGELLKNISYHYKKENTKYNLLEVKRLILNPSKIDQVSAVFDEALYYYSKEKRFSPKLFSDLEELMQECVQLTRIRLRLFYRFFPVL